MPQTTSPTEPRPRTNDDLAGIGKPMFDLYFKVSAGCLSVQLLILSVIFSVNSYFPQVLAVVAGIATPLLILTSIFPTYWCIRTLAWRCFREPQQKRMRQESLKPGVAKNAKDFPEVKDVDLRQHESLTWIPVYQGISRGMLLTVASIPTLMVILASLRHTFYETSPFGVGLSFGISLSLLAMLWLVIFDPAPTKKWVTARCRSELIRREQYLILGRIHPYNSHANTDTISKMRLALFKTDSLDELESSLPIVSYVNEDRPSEFLDLNDRVNCYLVNRIQKQLAHMKWAKADVEISGKTLTGVSIGASILFLLVAFFDTFSGDILTGAQLSDATRTLMSTSIAMGTILPAVIGFSTGLSAIQRTDLLSKIYGQCIKRLEKAEQMGLALKGKVDVDNTGLSSNFRELVMFTEYILTEELGQWLLVTDRKSSI